MKTRAIPVSLTILIVTSVQRGSESGGYQAAMYYDMFGVSQELEIFPIAGDPINVPLPFTLGGFACSPNGKALFAADGRGPGLAKRGLFKIEFNPTRASLIPGTLDLNFDSFAVSANEDTVVVAGALPGAPCGIFELRTHSGGGKNNRVRSPVYARGAWHASLRPQFIPGWKARHCSAKSPF
jgi:hypothetical protein